MVCTSENWRLMRRGLLVLISRIETSCEVMRISSIAVENIRMTTLGVRIFVLADWINDKNLTYQT
jgi:hypothetical protein